jgi:hypothetical protein
MGSFFIVSGSSFILFSIIKEMKPSIAFCGLDCSTCPIHLATLEEDQDTKTRKRAEIAEILAKIYKSTPKPEIICDCDGCKVAVGRLFTGCSGCKIRNCALERELENCAFCSSYPCEILKKHFAIDSDAQIRLERIRRQANGSG